MWVKFIPYILILVLGLLLFGIYQKSKVADLKAAQAIANLETVTDVNKENAETAAKLARQAEEDRKLTANILKKVEENNARLEELLRANDTDPDAQLPAGSSWDTFGDRLRDNRTRRSQVAG